ncbi:Transcription factor Adf-1 [Eumeta japonica]|uniref:Transcription factor Adf-1 n=1 Tax=Eumeta variegata TaxID=151549 RepID=A0A4C1URG4_EUMVA|nr:Transcription factor Adf-1 [Eumeta japonica]
MPFSEKLDIKLIKLVQKNPILYDHSHEHYMDFNAREVIWQKIGDELKRPASQCKSRWINIRDINRRILRNRLKNPQKRGNPYKYDRELAFMKQFYRDITIQSVDFSESIVDTKFVTTSDADVSPQEEYLGDEYNSDVSEAKNIISSNTKWKKKKRKHKSSDDFTRDDPAASSSKYSNDASQIDLDPSDQIDAFLLTVGATLRTFSPYHLNLAKSKIFAIVQEHDLQQIVERQNHSSTSDDIRTSPQTNFKNSLNDDQML